MEILWRDGILRIRQKPGNQNRIKVRVIQQQGAGLGSPSMHDQEEQQEKRAAALRTQEGMGPSPTADPVVF